jgi:hypothetical protein
MRITFEIPDDLAAKLAQPDRDLERVALEAIGLEAYRQRRISGYQLRTMLGIPSRYDLDGFLKEHEVYDYTVEDFESDLANNRALRERPAVPAPV